MENKSTRLGEERISKLLLTFSIPAIIGMIVNSAYTIIDRIFVGHKVGSLGLSGISITTPIAIILMAFGMLIGMGAGAMVSIKLGQHKKEEAERILGNSVTLIIILSVVVSAACLLSLEFLLKSFGASKEVMPYAKSFITIIIIGSVFQFTGFGLSNIIRAEGNPSISMYSMLINAILNIILDILFINVMGFGIKGAAVATVISQAASAAWVLYHFIYGKKSVLKLQLKYLKYDKEIILGILSIGIAPFSMQIAASFVNFMFNKELAHYSGDIGVGAMGVVSTIAIFILMPVFGINQGAQPILGYNYGAGKYKRVRKTVLLASVAASLITVCGFIVVMIMPKVLMKAFSSDPKMIDFGAKGLKIFLLAFPLVGFQIVCTNFFQAIGKAKKSMFLSMLRQVIVLIPMLFILPKIFKLNGIWAAGPVSDSIASVVTLMLIYFEFKHMKNADAE